MAPSAVVVPSQHWCGRGDGGVDDYFPGVEISITRGVEEIACGSNYCDRAPLYRPFMPTTLTLVTHTMCHMVLSLITSYARNPSANSYRFVRNIPYTNQNS